MPEWASVRGVLEQAVERFERAGLSYGHGTTNAVDEAAWLILHALGLPPTNLERHLDRPLSAAEAKAVNDLIERRVRTRKPAAYLLNEAWLGKHRFYVDERVIVPRSYIFELIEGGRLGPGPLPASAGARGDERGARQAGAHGDERGATRAGPQGDERGARQAGARGDERGARQAGARGDGIRILDLCTGSGCLAILAALAFPRAKVDAADLSEEALAVAARNVADYRLGGRVALVKSDLFSALAGRTYDLIVSNPPYVKASSMRKLPEEYRKEPVMALASGADGLEHTRVILAQAHGHLNPGGELVVEIGHNRRALEKAYPGLPFRWPRTSGGAGYVFRLSREELL